VWIAVAHPERGFWSAALGEAVAGLRPATLDDHGRIGSITKTFTAVAVLEQVDAGTLDLDDRVAELVPDLAARFPEIADLTIEQLLSMSSGLGDYANVPGAATALAVADPTRVWTPEDLIASALEASEVQPVGTPGYSTTNYTILGRILEAVTGRSVEEVVTSVATRAGLAETALLPGGQNQMPEPFTHGYIDPAGVTELAKVASTPLVAGTDVTEWSLSWGGAGGGMYSTIDDLFRWTATALGNELLSDSLATRRLELDTRIPEQGLRYGLGIFGLEGFGDWVGHTGQAIGWEAMSMYHPGTGATYAVMINSTGGLEPFLVAWIKLFGVGA
jgi:D-alanyl-D-alanine carboxypeptidase